MAFGSHVCSPRLPPRPALSCLYLYAAGRRARYRAQAAMLFSPDNRRTFRNMRVESPQPHRRRPRWWLHLAVVVGVIAALGPAAPEGSAPGSGWNPFSSFFDSSTFSAMEQIGVALAIVVSLFALVYAYVLGKRVFEAERGTAGMQFIAQAVRDGSNAYLRRQFTTVGVLLVFLTIAITITKWPWDANDPNAD